jgi:hypothetical protein
LDSVFTALGAFLTLREILSYTELFGCFLILSAAAICSLFVESNIGGIPTVDLNVTEDSITIAESADSIIAADGLYDNNLDKMAFNPLTSTIPCKESSYDYSAVNTNETDDNFESKI